MHLFTRETVTDRTQCIIFGGVAVSARVRGRGRMSEMEVSELCAGVSVQLVSSVFTIGLTLSTLSVLTER